MMSVPSKNKAVERDVGIDAPTWKVFQAPSTMGARSLAVVVAPAPK